MKDPVAFFHDTLALHEYMRLVVQRVFKTQSAWAEHLGLSPAYVSSVLDGSKRPNEKMLADLGLERVVTYRLKSAALAAQPGREETL